MGHMSLLLLLLLFRAGTASDVTAFQWFLISESRVLIGRRWTITTHCLHRTFSVIFRWRNCSTLRPLLPSSTAGRSSILRCTSMQTSWAKLRRPCAFRTNIPSRHVTLAPHQATLSYWRLSKVSSLEKIAVLEYFLVCSATVMSTCKTFCFNIITLTVWFN